MNLLHWVLIVADTLVAFFAAGHALLYKRDPRAALGWIAVCLMFPLAGPLLYFLFGINRVQTRAKKLERRWGWLRLEIGYERAEDTGEAVVSGLDVLSEFKDLALISDAVTRRPLVAGNEVEILQNGEQAYPAMLEAIAGARESVFLATYIFDTDSTGRRFIETLGRAVRRGVDVRVIVDGIGELYSRPRAGTLLARKGVRFTRFLPPKLMPPAFHINLRNHRKILVIDGRTGFTGGMNISDRHLAESRDKPSRMVDTHFRLTGPVVAQIEEVFLEDWSFSTGEHVAPPPAQARGSDGAICRTIVDGPNEDLDKLATILVGTIAVARRQVSIMTPYFLPSRELISALQAAALRGVEVNVVLPEKNNLPFVHWASTNMLWELLQRGVRCYYQPPPFVHTKLFLVDDLYAQIGSANIDPRSLRLNFEMAVEIYDRRVAGALSAFVDERLKDSREITLQEVDARPLWIRTRDALAWLFSPYL